MVRGFIEGCQWIESEAVGTDVLSGESRGDDRLGGGKLRGEGRPDALSAPRGRWLVGSSVIPSMPRPQPGCGSSRADPAAHCGSSPAADRDSGCWPAESGAPSWRRCHGEAAAMVARSPRFFGRRRTPRAGAGRPDVNRTSTPPQQPEGCRPQSRHRPVSNRQPLPFGATPW